MLAPDVQSQGQAAFPQSILLCNLYSHSKQGNTLLSSRGPTSRNFANRWNRSPQNWQITWDTSDQGSEGRDLHAEATAVPALQLANPICHPLHSPQQQLLCFQLLLGDLQGEDRPNRRHGSDRSVGAQNSARGPQAGRVFIYQGSILGTRSHAMSII